MKKRTIQVVGDVAYVPLTKGYTALIDADDVPLVEDWNWHAVVGATTVYAARGMSAGGKSRTIILHRVLISAPDGMDVDHINGDGLDNRRANLRIATRMENLCNKSIYCNNKSGFKGVYWDRHNKRWRSRIWLNRKQHSLGSHATAEAAHEAYVAGSARIHGEFGRAA